MDLSRLSAKCRKCPYKDTCDHKEMEALAYLPGMAYRGDCASPISPLDQPISRGAVIITMQPAEEQGRREPKLEPPLYEQWIKARERR